MQRRGRYGSSDDPTGEQAEFVGRVDSVGPEPPFASGLVAAYQTLGITVTDARQGSVQQGDQLEVDVLVAAGYPAIGVGTTGLPAIDGNVVQAGVLVLFDAVQAYGRWRCERLSTDGPQSSGYV
jgi:hypothetical protein